MSAVAAALTAPLARRRMTKVFAWLVGIAVFLVVLNLLGVDVSGWIEDFWDQIKDIPKGYLVAALSSRPCRRSSPGSRTTGS